MIFPSHNGKITEDTIRAAVKYLNSVKQKCDLCGVETKAGNMYFVENNKPLLIRMCEKCQEKIK